jgi:L-fuconolactonase
VTRSTAEIIIDTHQHFWDVPVPEAFSTWMTGRFADLNQPYLPTRLQGELRAAGVTASIAVQTWSSVDETHRYLRFAEAYDFVAGVVGWLDVTAASFADDLDAILGTANGRWLVGLRHTVDLDEKPQWFDQDDVRHAFRTLATRGLSFDLLIRPQYLSAATRAAQSVPECSFVLDHAGKPSLDVDGFAKWASQMGHLAELPNVYCKMSGLFTLERSPQDAYSPSDVVAEILDKFGPARVMFGSDWPVSTAAHSYPELVELTRTWVGDFSAAEQAAVFGINAMDFYGLSELVTPAVAESKGGLHD